MKKLYEQLSNATARMESLVCIGGMLGDGDSPAEPLQDLLEEEPAVFRRCFPDAPSWLHKALDSREDAAEAFGEWAVTTGKLGFALKIATPKMTHHGSKSCRYSWGYYMTAWVYGDTLDEAVARGLEWVAESRAYEKGSPAGKQQKAPT